MTKTMALALFAISSIVSIAQADEDQLRLDGNWWINESKPYKATYLAGFVDAMSFEDKRWSFALLLAQGKTFDPKLSSFAIKVRKSMEDARQQDFSHVTVGQLVDGLDNIYSDYRNRRIKTKDAITVVIRSLDGTPEDKLNEIVEWQRKHASE